MKKLTKEDLTRVIQNIDSIEPNDQRTNLLVEQVTTMESISASQEEL